MRKHTVLICDDNIAVHKSLTCCLKAERVEVISVFNGEAALQELQCKRVDVMVLDVVLPGIDGLEVCRRARKTSDVYIIMLSAKGNEMDRIVGLEVGADDYLSKPFSPREIAARIRRVLKRQNSVHEARKLTLAELTVLPDYYQVFVRDQEITLTTKEIDVLTLMLSNVGIALTRAQILNAAWSEGHLGDFRVVDTLIKRLRRKFPKDVHFAIQSIYGVGYKIEEVP